MMNYHVSMKGTSLPILYSEVASWSSRDFTDKLPNRARTELFPGDHTMIWN